MTKVYLGDKIITNKNFIGGEKHEGTFFRMRESSYGVVFDKPEEVDAKLKTLPKVDDLTLQLHYLNGGIQEKSGYYLDKKEFKHIKAFEDENKQKEEFICAMREKLYKKRLDIPKVIERTIGYIESYGRDIQYLHKEIKAKKEIIKKSEEEKKKLEDSLNDEFNIDEIIFLYDKLKANKKIVDIFYDSYNNYEYIIVKTAPLTYKHKDDSVKDFEIGGYILYIPTNKTIEIRAFNYTKHYMRGTNQHPCVDNRGHICMGAEVSKQIQFSRSQEDYRATILTLIHFLEKPNYGTPYTGAQFFQFAQPLDIEAKSIFDYLNKNETFYYKAKWDNDKYKKQLEEWDDQIEDDRAEDYEEPEYNEEDEEEDEN